MTAPDDPHDDPLPGQTPIDDVSGLRDRSIRTQAQLDGAEAENIRKATLKYLAARPTLRMAPFDLAWLRRLHKDMFGDVWSWAGAFRTRELNIGSPAHMIETELATLLDDLRAWEGLGMPLVEQGARLHHRSVHIHPFLDGNGRWSRLLTNIRLRLKGDQLVEWPERTIGRVSVIRGEYLEALRSADAGDYAPLIELHGLHTR